MCALEIPDQALMIMQQAGYTQPSTLLQSLGSSSFSPALSFFFFAFTARIKSARVETEADDALLSMEALDSPTCSESAVPRAPEIC